MHCPRILSKSITSLLTLGAIAAIQPVFLPAAKAASQTWDGEAGDNLWQSTVNWAGDLAFPGATSGFASTDDATFSTAGASGTIDLGGTLNVRSLLFGVAGGNAASFTIGDANDTLNFTTAGGITINAGVTAAQQIGVAGTTINLSTAASSTTTFTNNGTGLLTIGGNVVMAPPTGNSLLTVGGSGNTTASGTITNTGTGGSALLKTGAGTLTLSNGSTWSGSGALGRVPATSAGYPLVAREGTLLFNGGTHTVNGEAVIGGVVADGGAGQNAKIQVDAGTLNVLGYLSVGRGNGIGGVSSDLVLNNSAVLTANNFSAGFNGGGAANLPKGTITLNNSSSFTIAANGAFNLAESAGSNMTMTLNGTSVVTANGNATRFIGNLGTGTLNLNGSANFTDASTGLLYVGYRTGTGVINQSSGTFSHANGEVRVGGSDLSGTGVNGTGTWNLTGGTATVGSLVVARGNNNQNTVAGTVNVSAGTLTSIGDVLLGYAGVGNLGKLALSGTGTVNVGTTVAKWMQVGVWDTSKGQVDISGGNLNLNTNSSIKFNAQGTTGANVINLTGGAINFYSNDGSTGSGTIGGTGVLDMQTAGAAASSNTFNLNGGTLTVPQIISTATTGTRIFNFNGGTLKAATAGTLMTATAASRANVRDGGAIVNTNGLDVTIAQPLLQTNVSGDLGTGGLTKNGAGTLTLSGVNTYTGATAINGGTLLLSGSGSLATSTVLINSGAFVGKGTVAGVTVANLAANTLSNVAGSVLTTGALTFNGNAGVSLNYGGSAPIAVTGALTTTAGTQVTISGTSLAWANGLNNLISFGSFSGSISDFSKGVFTGLSGRQMADSLQLNGGNLALNVIGDTPVWTGANGGIWRQYAQNSATSAAPAWKLQSAGNSTDFWAADNAIFDDSSKGTSLATIHGGNVSPNSVIFNATKDYIIATDDGSGIATGSVTKSGTGTVTLLTPNTYAGVTTINAGTLQVGDGTTDGSISNSAITNNASLVYNLIGAQSQAAVISGTGTVTKSGTGILTLSAANSYTGGTTLTAGILNVNNATALGSGALTITGGMLDNTSGSAVTVSTNNAQNWNADFAFGGSGNLDLGSGAVTVGGTGDRAVLVPAGTLSVGEMRTAAGQGFIKQGAGTLALSSVGANVAGSLVNGVVNVAAGTLQINRTGSVAAGSGDLYVSGLAGTGTITNGASVARWLFVNNTGTSTFAGSLANGGTGGLGLDKLGSGTLVLTGSNSYSDVTTVEAGALQFQANSANTVGGASTAMSPNSKLTVNNGGVVQLRADSDTVFTTSVFNPAGASSTTYDVGAVATGTNNTLTLNSTAAIAVGGAVGATMTFNVTGANGDRLKLSGGSINFANNTNALVLNPTSANLTVASNVAGGTQTDQVLTLDGTSTDNVVSGSISATTAANLSVVKSNSSTWTLSGANTYAGATTVNAGKLVVSGSIAGSTTTVNGGTLSGTGSVGAVTVKGGGTLLAETSNFTTGNLSLAAASTFALSINTGAGTMSKATTGLLTLDASNSVALTINDLGGNAALSPGLSFTLIDYADGGWNGGLFSYNGTVIADDAKILVGANEYRLSYNGIDGNTSAVSLAVVPEPASATLLLAGAGSLLGLRRFRRRSA